MVRTFSKVASPLVAAVAAALMGAAVSAAAPSYHFDLVAQPMSQALQRFGQISGQQIIVSSEFVEQLTAPELKGEFTAEAALEKLLQNTGLVAVRSSSGALMIRQAGSSADQSSADANDDSVLLDTVTVFGRATQYTQKDIPQTLTTFNPEFLASVAAVDTYNVLRFVPTSASRYSEFGFNPGESVIRGFQSVRTINGVTLDTMNHGADLVNVERVEVLMGPASVLYGSMQPGAVVNLVTKRPKDAFHFSAEAGFGSYNDQRYSIDVGGPLSDRVRVRLNAEWRDRESFLDYWSLNKIVVAPAIEIDLTDRTLLTLEGLYSRNHWGAGTWLGGPAAGLLTANPNGKYRRSFFASNPDEEETGTTRRARRVEARLKHSFTDTLTAQLVTTYTYGQEDARDIVSNGFLNTDFRTLRMLRFIAVDSRSDDIAARLDLAGEFETGPARHRFVIGGDYLSQEADNFKGRANVATTSLDLYNPVYNSVVPNPIRINGSGIQTDTNGVFLQDRISFAEKLHVILGVRYAKIDSENVFQAAGTTTRVTTKLSQDAWPTQFGAVYELTPDVSLFANRSESFLPRSGTTAGAKPFPPEEGNQIEAGAKFTLGRTGLVGNLAVFQVEKPDVLAPDPNNPGFQLPLGDVKSQGVELSVNGQPLPNWTLYAAFAHMKTEVNTTDANLDGNELSNAPKNTFSLMSRYDLVGGLFDGLAFSVAVQNVNARFADDQNTLRLPGHTRVDLGAHYPVNQHFEVSLLVNNVTDENVYAAISANRISYDAYRNYLLRIGYKL
ncbi:TonB-dependent siderophore receptor [Steroidobacter sp.]|uniref:TonB-dependent siderophore receptor n=1 Tax=Steroidobacter sp. TaxID=1978227 RepID=UPI001A623883|nr:TonB-dependent receptor [Steroidobacter sp.]MBL8267173.1 TonB-dependent receptor [Steroidobacter sp.]